MYTITIIIRKNDRKTAHENNSSLNCRRISLVLGIKKLPKYKDITAMQIAANI